MNIVEIAKEIATKAHEGQKRKRGDDYITHPEGVAAKLDDEMSKAVAWMHDVIEDTEVMIEDIEEAFEGYPNIKILIESLDALTHRVGEPYLDYILRVKKFHLAKKVKLADIEHNMSTCPPEWKNAKTKWTLARYILKN